MHGVAPQAEREREAFLAQRAQQALVEAAEAERAAQGEAAAAAAKAADLERLRQVQCLLRLTFVISFSCMQVLDNS